MLLLGTFAAAVAPASATRVDLTLAKPRITAAADRLTVTGNLTADARTQVRIAGTGIDESVACRTRPPLRERGTATFALGAGSGNRDPFTPRLTAADSLIASLDCDVAERRRIDNMLPINSLAGNLADGTLDSALAPALQLPTPGVGRPMVVPLNPRRPTLRNAARGLAYSAD